MAQKSHPQNISLLVPLLENNIQYCKQQQWQVTVYGLGVLAALYTAITADKFPCLPWYAGGSHTAWLTGIVCGVVSASASCMLVALQFSLRKFRMRQYHAHRDLGIPEKPYSAGIAKLRDPWRGYDVFLSLCASYWLTALCIVTTQLAKTDYGCSVPFIYFITMLPMSLPILYWRAKLRETANE